MQNACATYQEMQFIGMRSLSPGTSVQVVSPDAQLKSSIRAACVAGRGQAMFHPGSVGLFGFLPLPAAGLLPGYASTKRRILPTTTSNRSKPNALSVAGKAESLSRLNVPAGTLITSQQL
jgi:hypothetical protein